MLGVESAYESACKKVASRIVQQQCQTISEVSGIIRQAAAEFALDTMPRHEDVIRFLPQPSGYRRMLMVRPAKSASGVAVITVMPKPYACPHGRCVYCPGGPDMNTPLSYMGTEPATRIAQQLHYDPLSQVRSKLEQLKSRGHDTSKSEVVLVGGTFPFMPQQYQLEFAKSCYEALNGKMAADLETAKSENETASNRMVGLTVETKPDYCRQQHIGLMLEMGVTRVEIGVQTLRDSVYRIVNRGHSLQDVKSAFSSARESGLKIVAHMMPGLPTSSPEHDIEDLRRLFDDEAFRPDMIKIYPTLVLKGTGLYELYQRGSYRAYTDDDLVHILTEVKKVVPGWVRIMRVQREIEPADIVAGPKSGNLRQIVLARLKSQGLRCRCIRCREVGLQKAGYEESEVVLRRTEYQASGGREVFVSLESIDGDVILGFLRLRHLKSPHRQELCNSTVIRELHVYGQAVGIGLRDSDSAQHRGYGARLLREAETISKGELQAEKIAVTSAVGTRGYYRKFGYAPDGPYMSKVLA